MGPEWIRTSFFLTTLIVHVASQGVPSPPRLVSVACGNRAATVQWQQGADSEHPATGYFLQYNDSFTPDSWTVLPEIAASETQHTVGLSPWMTYTFRVVASTKAGLSPPSQLSAECRTQADVPHRNPGNVKAEGREPTNIVISWDPMPEAEHNAPGFAYRVYWKRDDSHDQWSSADIYDWRHGAMVIPDQPPYARYRVKVAALNQRGEAVPPHEVTGYSGEGVPMQSPRNFVILHLSTNEVVLKWDPVPEESLQGRHKGYTIQVWPDDGDELSVQETTTNAETTRAHVSIPPNSKVNARVYARNGRTAGPPSQILTFHTPDGVPGPVQNFEAYPLGSTAFYLIWRRPNFPNGVLTSYKIYYQTIFGTTLGTKMERKPSIPIQQTRAKLARLQPNTKYRIYIAATTRGGEGLPYFIEHTTGNNVAVKPSVPFFYWIQETLEDGVASIRIVWLPDLEGHPGSYFYVKRRLKGETEFSDTDPEVDEDFIVVRDLVPCRSYEFQLVAVDGNFTTESSVKEVTVETEEECSVARNELEDEV